jgi:hypothetical protein
MTCAIVVHSIMMQLQQHQLQLAQSFDILPLREILVLISSEWKYRCKLAAPVSQRCCNLADVIVIDCVGFYLLLGFVLLVISCVLVACRRYRIAKFIRIYRWACRWLSKARCTKSAL